MGERQGGDGVTRALNWEEGRLGWCFEPQRFPKVASAKTMVGTLCADRGTMLESYLGSEEEGPPIGTRSTESTCCSLYLLEGC